jgi:hypothetical protein
LSTHATALQVLVQLVEDLAFHRSGLVDRVEMGPAIAIFQTRVSLMRSLWTCGP